MKRSIPIAAIVLLTGVLVWVIWLWHPVADQSGVGRRLGLAAPPSGGDFTLRSWRGPVSTKDLRGNVLLIYFGYTSCPDICPTNLALVTNALKALTPSELGRVQVIFVSVDPQRDTLERLREYTAYFHPSILGVTGTPGEVADAAKLYGAAYRRAEATDSAMGYTVDHSAYTYVVDPAGRLAQVLDHGTPSDRIIAVIRGLLEGPGAKEGSTSDR